MEREGPHPVNLLPPAPFCHPAPSLHRCRFFFLPHLATTAATAPTASLLLLHPLLSVVAIGLAAAGELLRDDGCLHLPPETSPFSSVAPSSCISSTGVAVNHSSCGRSVPLGTRSAASLTRLRPAVPSSLSGRLHLRPSPSPRGSSDLDCL